MNNTLSVSQLITIIKDTISADNRLQHLFVTGEISNFTLHKYGHAYFSLKDDKSKISCVMFKNNFSSVKFTPKDGLAVLISGYISVYQAGGQLQINVISIQETGVGDLHLKLEELKAKLQKEGLFALEHKKAIPKYPMKIAVIVAKDSAAQADIEINLKRRWPIAKSDLYPANMQGRYAAKEIVEQLITIDKSDYDLLIIARGGGSFEDLYCFNEEKLIRTIYCLNTPVVTGIGHESDVTLADMVADLRAATPTAAIELVTPNVMDEKQHLLTLKEQLLSVLLSNYENSNMIFTVCKQKLHTYHGTLLRAFDAFRLLQMEFLKKLDSFSGEQQVLFNNYSLQITSVINQSMTSNCKKLEQYEQLLYAFNPLKILERGYAIISKDEHLVTSVTEVDSGDRIKIQLKDGSLSSKIEDKTNGKEV